MGGDANEENVVKVEFDQEHGRNYAVCVGCCYIPLISGCLCLPCLPCTILWAVKEFQSQKCTVDDHRIHYSGGWINKVEKTVPLDRVQDLAIQEGCVQRYCGVSSLLVQTAGNSGPEARAELTLNSVVEPRRLRASIIQRRDAIVLGQGAGGPAAAGGGVDFVSRQPTAAASMDVVGELRALRESVTRIEHLVERAVVERAAGQQAEKRDLQDKV